MHNLRGFCRIICCLLINAVKSIYVVLFLLKVSCRNLNNHAPISPLSLETSTSSYQEERGTSMLSLSDHIGLLVTISYVHS